MSDTAQMVVDLRATDDAVRAKGWVAPGLGVPGAPLGLLGSTLDPLSGLAAAGLSWFTPLVSFLGDGLTQLRGGDGASVTSGSQDFGAAGQDIAGVAEEYRASTSAQTSGWSGPAATEYRDTAARHADGIAGLGEASNTVGSAIIGAGQVVAQAIAEVTELIAEAVAQIVPIMTQAVARAGETFGQSVVEAIPPCVGIAVEYALRIAAKLAALVASGDNLMKLVQGGMAVVDLIRTALSGISQQSVSVAAEPGPGAGTSPGTETGAGAIPDVGAEAGTGAGQRQGGGPANALGAAESGAAGPAALAGGRGGAVPRPPGMSTVDDAVVPNDVATQSSAAVPPAQSAVSPAGGASGAAPGGPVPVGAGLVPGARVGAGSGADTTRQGNGQPARAAGNGGGTPGAVPLGATGGRAGETDKEHQRKYRVVEDHEEAFEVAPAVITSYVKRNDR